MASLSSLATVSSIRAARIRPRTASLRFGYWCPSRYSSNFWSSSPPIATLKRTSGSLDMVILGGKGRGRSWTHCNPRPAPASTDLGDLDPLALPVRAGDGGLDEGHARDPVEDAGVLERGRHGLAEPA